MQRRLTMDLFAWLQSARNGIRVTEPDGMGEFPNAAAEPLTGFETYKGA
jgi:hypothetical protein